MIHSVSLSSGYTAYKSTVADKTKETTAGKAAAAEKEAAGAKETNEAKETNRKETNHSGVILDFNNKTEESGTYSNIRTNKANAKEIAAIKQQTEDALAPLRQLVEKLFKEQGRNYDKALGNTAGDLVDVTPEIRSESLSLISDGGYYSVENTSSRLVDFAIAISGGDKSKISEIRSSIDKGFSAAQKAFGGQLPEISDKTYKMTMEKLDAWENSVE